MSVEPPIEAYELFDLIADLIGNPAQWPSKIVSLWWSRNIKHLERMQVAAFAYVNCLDPVIFLEWCDIIGWARDANARIELASWIYSFDTNPEKWHSIYAYNVWWHRYEFINGVVKFNMRLGQPHP